MLLPLLVDAVGELGYDNFVQDLFLQGSNNWYLAHYCCFIKSILCFWIRQLLHYSSNGQYTKSSLTRQTMCNDRMVLVQQGDVTVIFYGTVKPRVPSSSPNLGPIDNMITCTFVESHFRLSFASRAECCNFYLIIIVYFVTLLFLVNMPTVNRDPDCNQLRQWY
jgi:hypothetical protein